jgi:hypothetical protein
VPITVSPGPATGPTGSVGSVIEIGPTGTVFAQPITIAFQYTDSELGGLPPSDFAVETSTDGTTWMPLSQIVVDDLAHTIAGQTTHLSPYVLVQQGVGGQNNSAADAASNVSNGGPDAAQTYGDASTITTGATSDAALAVGADATVTGGGSGGGGSDGGSPVLEDASTGSAPDGSAQPCPTAPNPSTLPNGNVMPGSTILGGAQINLIGGYATLVTGYSASSGVFTADLTLTFTNYQNPWGYFTAGANARNTTEVVVTAAEQTSKISGGAQFTQGSYPVTLGQLEAVGAGGACQPQTATTCAPSTDSMLAIESLTMTEIIGSLDVLCVSADGGNDQIAISSFDIPVIEYGDGGVPTTPQCCLSVPLP